MFTEPKGHKERTGWIEVICGSMFSGKTEELIRRLRRAQIANRKVEIFKPRLDTRYHETDIVSHDSSQIRSTPLENSGDILPLSQDIEVVGIDEAQFLDAQAPKVVEELACKGIRVIVAGLDMDSDARPFGPLPALLAVADYITKLHAICAKCGDIAHFSYRKSDKKEQILIGEKNHYEPRCRDCFYKGYDA